jgi:transposase
MRKSFNGLCGLVRNELGKNPQSGEVFVFFNKRRTLVKILQWDLSGFVIYYKRLEAGTFGRLTNVDTQAGTLIKGDELMLLLEGIELKNIRRRKRYFSQPFF